MKLIVKKVAEGIFDFCESSNGILYDGMIYGGTEVSLSYANDALKVAVKTGEVGVYDLTDLNYDDGNEIIGFASMNEFIIALKDAGFTGNFNTPQAGGGSSKVTAFTCNVGSGSITNLVFQKNDHNLNISNFNDFNSFDSCGISKTNGWDIEKTIIIGNCTADDGTNAFAVAYNKQTSDNGNLYFNKGYNLPTNLTIKIEEFN